MIKERVSSTESTQEIAHQSYFPCQTPAGSTQNSLRNTVAELILSNLNMQSADTTHQNCKSPHSNITLTCK